MLRRLLGTSYGWVEELLMLLVLQELFWYHLRCCILRVARKWSERRPRIPGADPLLAVLMAECIFEREKESVGRWDVQWCRFGLVLGLI